jgi:hypothetical protein
MHFFTKIQFETLHEDYPHSLISLVDVVLDEGWLVSFYAGTIKIDAPDSGGHSQTRRTTTLRICMQY